MELHSFGSSIFVPALDDTEPQPARGPDEDVLVAVVFLKALAGDLRAPAHHVLDKPLTVGRDRSCQIVIDESIVSREHARLVPATDGVDVHDLGTRNGTFVDGSRVSSVRAGLGSVIRVGDTVICLRATPRVLPHARRVQIENALRDADGNVRKASAALGMARSHLYRLVERFAVDINRYRR